MSGTLAAGSALISAAPHVFYPSKRREGFSIVTVVNRRMEGTCLHGMGHGALLAAVDSLSAPIRKLSPAGPRAGAASFREEATAMLSEVARRANAICDSVCLPALCIVALCLLFFTDS